MSHMINGKFIGAALVAFALLAGCDKDPTERSGEAVDNAPRGTATELDEADRLRESAEHTRDCIDSNMENC